MDQQLPPQESKQAGEQPKVVSKQQPSSTGNWTLGIAIVVIGGVLLARNLGVDLFFLEFDNWWALFILLAAIGPLRQAYTSYQREGFNNTVANSLVSAGTIVVIALIFLLDLSVMVWWPVFVIIGGLYLLTSRGNL